jgi:hypothetical protein
VRWRTEAFAARRYGVRIGRSVGTQIFESILPRRTKMKATKFWITSAATIAAAGALGLAIAQTTDYKDQGGSRPGGAANQEPAAPAKSMSSDTRSSSTSSTSSTSSSAATEQPIAKVKADRG